MSQLPIPGYDPNGDPPAGSPGLPKPDKPTYAGPTGRALEDQWMSFANNELGQKGQVGVAGGNAQANAGAAAARWNLGGTVDAYNAKYGGSARAVGEDKIDFGDGSGARDVIEGGGDNSKWWMGGADGGGGGGGGGRPGGPIDRPTGGGWRDAGYDTGPGAWGQGGGGGYGGGGWCVADDTPILLADGGEIQARFLTVGMLVRTQHEDSLAWGNHAIEAVELAWQPVFRAEGFPRATGEHLFWIDGAWVRMDAIGVPDRSAWVAKIAVAGARTYVSAGVLSHNKRADGPEL